LGQNISGFDSLQQSRAKTRKFSHYQSQKERNMFVAAERFMSGLVTVHGNHPVSTDRRGTWYPPHARPVDS
jgi:hypothetical protein